MRGGVIFKRTERGKRRESVRVKNSSKVSPEAKTHSPLFHTISSCYPEEDNCPQDTKDIHIQIMFPILFSFYSDHNDSMTLM